ncbi:hypothetical protein ABT160_23615 [Streptomyces sp. NPDC001941]|uniref:hypothetical protein n=1 Tax=Streptomyces sp. NPDC001941 TaxID=3154659 RepID=UPI00331E001C
MPAREAERPEELYDVRWELTMDGDAQATAEILPSGGAAEAVGWMRATNEGGFEVSASGTGWVRVSNVAAGVVFVHGYLAGWAAAEEDAVTP